MTPITRHSLLMSHFNCSFADILETLLAAGSKFVEAADWFAKAIDSTEGTVMLKVENYLSDTSLGDMAYYEVKRTINQVKFDVPAGEKQGVSATGFIFSQTEGLVGWNLPSTDMKVVIYWRVTPPLSGKSNKLGIGFVNGTGAYWLNKLVTSDEDIFLPMLGVHEYAKSGATIQCCYKDLCLQGLMNSKHHSNATVRILPRKATKLFNQATPPLVAQKYLDQILGLPNTCTSTSNSACKVSVSVTSMIMFFIALTLCM